MKVLLACSDFYSYADALLEAFKDLGVDTYMYLFSDNTRNELIGKSIYKFSRFCYKIVGKEDRVVKHFNSNMQLESDNLYKIYCEINPDILVSFPGYSLNCNILKKITCRKILWVYDAIENIPFMEKVLHGYDAIYTFEKTDVKKYRKLGVSADFLPLCADNRYYFPIDNDRDIDVSFIGNLSSERRRMIKNIKRKLPDISIQAYGNYVGKYDFVKRFIRNHSFESEIFTNLNILPESANLIYSRSKICININKHQTIYGGNMRLYEILATNSFQIVNCNDYIDSEFNGCVVSYSDTDELVKKIEYYLEHESERIRIAQNGYEKVMREDLFYNRAKKILEDNT